jgi:hypothetical protein
MTIIGGIFPDFGRNSVTDRFSVGFLLKPTLSHFVRFEEFHPVYMLQELGVIPCKQWDDIHVIISQYKLKLLKLLWAGKTHRCVEPAFHERTSKYN